MILHHRFIEIAKKYRKKVAIHCLATNRQVTYSQLLTSCLVVSLYFKKLKEQNIGIMLPTSAPIAIAYFGTLLAGKTPVMINYSTGALENARYAQQKCYFKTIVTSRKMLDTLGIKPIDGMLCLEDILPRISLSEKLQGLLISKLPSSIIKSMLPPVKEDDNAVILFTSGSEKDPRAVQLTYRNISANLCDFEKVLDIDHRYIVMGNLPLFHVFGLTVTFFVPLIYGGQFVAHPNPLDYKAICDAIKKYKVWLVVGTPTFFNGYLRKAEPGTFDSVRVMIAGADKLPEQLRDQYKEKHNVLLCEGYGTTETSPVISTNLPSHNRPGSVGRPLPNVQIKILDIDTDRELPAGNIGKIMVKGDLVTKGYLGDLEETSLRIRNGWYDTGDMGFLDKDGYLYHRGRLKRFVKIGGEMVSLVQVEQELEKLLPENVLCCVVDVPNAVKGAEIVVAITTEEIGTKQVLRELGRRLPKIAVPKRFMVVPNLPIMGNGKVNFREVEKICRQQAGKS